MRAISKNSEFLVLLQFAPVKTAMTSRQSFPEDCWKPLFLNSDTIIVQVFQNNPLLQIWPDIFQGTGENFKEQSTVSPDSASYEKHLALSFPDSSW